MDFLNRTRGTDRRKVQGSLITNLHLAHQNLAAGAAKWNPQSPRGSAVASATANAALTAEHGLASAPNTLRQPNTMSALLKPERSERSDPGMKVKGTLRGQRVSQAVEATPESKAMRGDMDWRQEAVKDATNAALEGGVRKGKVRKISKKYTAKKTRRQR